MYIYMMYISFHLFDALYFAYSKAIRIGKMVACKEQGENGME